MRVEHIGIAVKDLTAVADQYQKLFPGIKIVPEPVADGSMKMAIAHFANIKIELMEPLKEDSPVGKFIAKNGEGIHHLAFLTDDMEASLANAAACDIRLVTEKPYIGAEGFLVAFLHPKDTHGVLSEFCQKPIS
ncbi:methylmalonyl-CoA epimerase [Candidatus Formimonas warabiya]|uniref:Methylmalonyl-CoA epimerase n=1 Tax=Formimonas warabiya TaxID=1761012 RepID=A0A3G1KQ53_FORW1|nr:methylmalonyl-CoA epimerase [Candidatus Formimonas warabiya]ATW24594.1 methylmalonyl-CoA epimerase [Candidatus Formimonas warabiya]